jgi:hypothetical protein
VTNPESERLFDHSDENNFGIIPIEKIIENI